MLLRQFQQNGFGDIIKSWIGTGRNEAISPTQLRQAIGQDTVNDLSRQTGAPQDDLLSQLSKYLPGVIDKLTPDGQLPNQSDLLPGPGTAEIGMEGERAVGIVATTVRTVR